MLRCCVYLSLREMYGVFGTDKLLLELRSGSNITAEPCKRMMERAQALFLLRSVALY